MHPSGSPDNQPSDPHALRSPPPLAAPSPLAEVPAAPVRPWGGWATLGWGIVMIAAFVGAQVVVVLSAVVLLAIAGKHPDMDELSDHGMLLALSTCASTPAVIGLCRIVARRRNIDPDVYLAIRWPPPRTVIGWCVALLLFILISDTTTWLLGREVVPEFMRSAYSSAVFPPLLWVALILLAPATEEIFFRGFLITGFKESKLGATGAVIVTALAWAVIHLQYDLYGIGVIFVLGLLLGAARVKTESVPLCILMHGLMNLVATLEVIWVLRHAP